MSALRAVPDGPHGDAPQDAGLPPAAPDGDGDSGPADDGRRYSVTDGPANVRWLRSELGTPNMPGVFLRGGKLVYVASITDEGYIPPRHPEDDNGPATVTPLTAIGLSTRVGDYYRVEKYDGRTRSTRPAHFPNEDCQRVMETADQLPYVNVLQGVTHTPVARADVGLLTEPGYDEESGFLLEPTVVVDPPASAPSEQQVAAATKFLRDMVADFVWGDDDSEANFFGALLTPLMRLATPAPYKLVAITARERGSGKSLLAEVLRTVHGGSLSTWPSSDDELEKFISSTLHCTTAPIVQVDNVRGVLASGRLEALATSSTYAVRVLGSTNKHTLANDRLWCFTGNNMSIGGDLGRRMLWIDIDPKVEKPEERTGFSIPDLPRYVKVNRARILKALLTWIAAWDAAERPLAGEVTSDSYGQWTASVRSILGMAGVPGTFAAPNPERESTANPEESEWGEFLAAVHAVMGTQAWTSKHLTDLIDKAPRAFQVEMGGFAAEQDNGEREDAARLRDALPEQLLEKVARSSAGAGTIKKSLGKWVGNRKGQWHGGYTVLSAGEDRNKVALWQVFASDDPEYQDLMDRTRRGRS